MSINYNYEIINVDEAARCMEVVYTADGHETQHIGARLPYEGEQVEQVIRMYAPIAYWQEKMRVVVPPAVGVSGAIPAADEEAANLAAIAELEAQQVGSQPISEGTQTL
jgi:hypothetical protein